MAKHWEDEYLDLVQHILEKGTEKNDRTGVGTKSIFGANIRINLQEGFPVLTSRKLFYKTAVSELLWFLEGSTDERRLAEIHYGLPREEIIDKTTIWTANANHQGKNLGYRNDDIVKELGPVYGNQWRNFGGIDQISNIINQIKYDPDSRRHFVSAWNPPELDKMALPPCHLNFQFYVDNGKLSCMFSMRSTDIPIGLPTNIFSYALLTHMIAQVCNLDVGELIYNGGDVHIYNNQVESVIELLSRKPKSPPKLKLNQRNSIFDFVMEDVELEGYEHHPVIKIPFAV